MNDLGQGGLLLAYMHVFLLFLCPPSFCRHFVLISKQIKANYINEGYEF